MNIVHTHYIPPPEDAWRQQRTTLCERCLHRTQSRRARTASDLLDASCYRRSSRLKVRATHAWFG